ncbi:phospholipase D family protein [Brevundimonas sp. 374]|uniref:phospholipase D family protein n=1 Tax=Brevundimonas sp. 374 TaxID=1150400 RepID=UPI00115F800C|nr:phospholipase D family protein [Brevundimonas sp. 374]
MAAVAYFGRGGHELLPLRAGSFLVVDATIPTVRSGATHPSSLAELRKAGVHIFSARKLHAKMFAFDRSAFVGSANVSINSRDHLIEAIVKFDGKTRLEAVRAAVRALCITEMSLDDLQFLSSKYRPPKIPPAEGAQQSKLQTLVMELTLEQGKGRESQVQPPRPVWESYFGLDYDQVSLPSFTLVNENDPSNVAVQRSVVRHHHNLTIEVTDAHPPRPAILQMRRRAKNFFSYKVIRPNDPNFAELRAMLKAAPNPLWTSGRSWIVI